MDHVQKSTASNFNSTSGSLPGSHGTTLSSGDNPHLPGTDAHLAFEWTAVLAGRRDDSAEENHRHWDTPRGIAILEAATTKYGWYSRRYELQNSGDSVPAAYRTDLMSHIWEIWNSPAMETKDAPLAYTNRTLKKRLGHQNKLDRMRTSNDADRRNSFTGETLADGTYNPLTVLFADNGSEAMGQQEDTVSAEAERRAGGADALTFRSAALNGVVGLLCMVGLDTGTAGALVEFILERGSETTSAKSAYDSVTRCAVSRTVTRDGVAIRVAGIPEQLRISVAVFKQATSLILGNSAGDTGVLFVELTALPYGPMAGPLSVKNVLNSTLGLLAAAPVPSAAVDAQIKELTRFKKATAAATKLTVRALAAQNLGSERAQSK
jgi:hypothetical protein